MKLYVLPWPCIIDSLAVKKHPCASQLLEVLADTGTSQVSGYELIHGVHLPDLHIREEDLQVVMHCHHSIRHVCKVDFLWPSLCLCQIHVFGYLDFSTELHTEVELCTL